MTKYVVNTGWWDAGTFVMPVYRRDEMDRNYGTGYYCDATGSSNLDQKDREAALIYAMEYGLEEAAKRHPKIFKRFPL